MCHDASASPVPMCSTYRCASGCVHLVWNNVTLHFFPKEWGLLVETVNETDRLIREERERPFPGLTPM